MCVKVEGAIKNRSRRRAAARLGVATAAHTNYATFYTFFNESVLKKLAEAAVASRAQQLAASRRVALKECPVPLMGDDVFMRRRRRRRTPRIRISSPGRAFLFCLRLLERCPANASTHAFIQF